ncbi:hypothetical protein IAT38_002782 [Cryptococcus sp. DSM 104549]
MEPNANLVCSRPQRNGSRQQLAIQNAANRYPHPSVIESFTSLFTSTPPPPSSTSRLPQDPVVVGVLSALAATAITLGSIQGYRRYWRRIKNSDYVTTGMLDRKVWVRGVVTSVGDGDNIRLFHTPGPFFRYPFKLRSIPTTAKALKDETIHIRIAGVDAPENAHFGNPAQPHAKESLEWLRATVLGKRMRCQLLSKDQYNRIVAAPYISRTFWFDQPLPLLMLKEGMAVVYESGGAEYGAWGLDKMKALEAEAKQHKRGLWALKKFESPADYKARVKSAAAETETPTVTRRRSSSKGLLGMLKGFFGVRR